MSRRRWPRLDLRDDPQLIAEYKKRREKVWPEILRSIKGSGINGSG
jgi:L-rhamnose mutarotase